MNISNEKEDIEMKNLNTIANEWIENLNAIDIYPNKISKF